jgi:hypothetical protein
MKVIDVVKGRRIAALDFTKGALVLFMVLYHWLNYFARPELDYRYLRFLPPSFIFITGFLISHLYLSGPAVDMSVSKRLLTRAVKLVMVFGVLNVARAAVLAALSSGSAATDRLTVANILSVFIVGPDVADKVMSFYILIPISYLLMLSAALLWCYQSFRYVFHLTSALLLVAVAVLSVEGIHSQNLEFVAIGMLGVLAGFLRIDTINRIAGQQYVLALLYVAYVAAITRWNTPFALLVPGVCLTLLVIYRMGFGDVEGDWLRRHVSLLGKYSLFGYVAQIAILQVMSAGLRHVGAGQSVLLVSFVLAFASTMIAVELVDRFKARSIIVNRLYRAAFA